MKIPLHRLKYYSEQVGFFFLSATLFLISFPRFISLYSIALFLVSGLILWVTDFEDNKRYFAENWFLIAPPLLYFIINLISFILQKGEISLIETRLMFLLIPLFGIPLLRLTNLNSRLFQLLKYFILGLSVISLFLVLRTIIIFITKVPHDIPGNEYLQQHNPDFFSNGFSILEHPSYLSMKILFALIILIRFWEQWNFNKVLQWGLFFLFSVMIFMLASKAGIVAWIFIGLTFILYNFKKRSVSRVLYLIMIPVIIGFTYLSVKNIIRISYFFVYTGRGLSQTNFDWKNLDQRTREWYSAIQLIKEKPITGFGLGRVEERMVKEFRINGWEEEASLNLNAHNQFLEAQMTFGVAGSLSLIWMLLTPLIFRKHLKYPRLALAFVLMMSFFFLFESMLNRQWGIMFFVLFYCILMLNNNLHENDLNLSTNEQPH